VARLFSEAGSVIDFAEAGSNTFVLRKITLRTTHCSAGRPRTRSRELYALVL